MCKIEVGLIFSALDELFGTGYLDAAAEDFDCLLEFFRFGICGRDSEVAVVRIAAVGIC